MRVAWPAPINHKVGANMSAKKKSDDKKGRLAEALMKQRSKQTWQPLLEHLGLTDEDIIDRLVRLLVTHLLLDRALTAGLTTRLVDPRSQSSFASVEAMVGKIEMAKRIGLAKASKIISDSCAENIYAVNDVRNNIVHYQRGKGWRLDAVKELASDEAFDECTFKAFVALDEIFALSKQA